MQGELLLLSHRMPNDRIGQEARRLIDSIARLRRDLGDLEAASFIEQRELSRARYQEKGK